MKVRLTGQTGHCDNCGRFSGKLTILRELMYKNRCVSGDYWCDNCLQKFEQWEKDNQQIKRTQNAAPLI